MVKIPGTRDRSRNKGYGSLNQLGSANLEKKNRHPGFFDNECKEDRFELEKIAERQWKPRVPHVLAPRENAAWQQMHRSILIDVMPNSVRAPSPKRAGRSPPPTPLQKAASPAPASASSPGSRRKSPSPKSS